MKKVWKLTLGGLHQKIFNILLIFLLVLIVFASTVSIFQANLLNKTVTETNKEQERSIENISGTTMQAVLETSMTKSNAMQAYIADEMFSDIKSDVLTLQSLAESIFENQSIYDAYPISTPNVTADGNFTAQVLYEQGVDYTKSEYLGLAANMSETMIALCDSSDYLNNCFFGLADGTHICVDRFPSNKYDADGNLLPFAVRERPWYKGAVGKGDVYFSGIEIDTYTDKIGIECSAPVYVNDRLIGVVGADLFLDEMASYVNSSSSEGGFICIINDLGQVVFAPDNNGIFTVETVSTAEDLRISSDTDLADFVSEALEKRTGLVSVNTHGKEYYMTGSPIETVGWTAVSVIDKEVTQQPTKQLISEYDRINENSVEVFRKSSADLESVIILVTALILMISLYSAIKVASRIVKPIESMTAEIIEGANTGKLFEMKDIYKTGDELEVLAESFDDLSKKTRKYISDITRITAEKERINTELALAAQIQLNTIPNIFPPYPNRDDFALHASMVPAKEVGGDFYDFFLIDDDHLGMIMADVSGKGVPAALFMMSSKILLENLALGGIEPAELLTKANEQICRDNKTDMFVTVWYGVLEISTGNVKAANAGHEYPILKDNDGTYRLFKDKHGFVLGGMQGIKYKQYEFTMDHGGVLYVYTDGVPEAANAELEQFGTDRLLKVLNDNANDDPKVVLETVKNEVDNYVGDAERFDDMTMLCVRRT